ncbi:tpr repeat nuclear phosphoprotein/ctr9, putative [Entamoeba invadens IP1]|uniref:tpr repeat nuclear phosphoprotein/ctr9, putative n=1 Tax=Entamoeba invadens IP1 TaxID=370355 RepID=UPI0002C3D840|nr:tpr repeat nuclear phosphoprotein/ctr9, putative [Entamoeba invadens IP1]ELP93906.1 tpr repeat nuclear phosphoprotein/ctr9, putative [Entamoeba invadens IP1]|eukprot:XP_004260677.1 tpr repeat nuclear phosphoprotein/ctr9, putative [Entamoeba invadens IP1]
MSEVKDTFFPDPIRLNIDPTRFVTITRPISVNLQRLASYFRKDPISTLQVAQELVRENRRSEATRFIEDTILSNPPSTLSQSILKQFMLLSASLLVKPEMTQNDVQKVENKLSNATIRDTAIAHCIAGYTNFYMNKHPRNEFKRALEIDPNCTPAIVGLALLETKLGNERTALSYYKQAVSQQPTNPSIRCGAARIFYLQRAFKQSIKCFESALVLDKTCLDALVSLSRIYWNLRTPEAVKRALLFAERALAVDRNNVDVLYVLSEAAMFSKNYKKAEEFCTRIVELGNTADKAYGHFTLGRVKHFEKKFEDAMKEYLEAEKMDKDESMPQIRFRIAQLEFKKKEYKKVEDRLLIVVKKISDDFDVLKLLGYSQLKLNKKSDAIANLSKASLIKTDEKVEITLAMLLEESEPRHASMHYEKIENKNEEALNNIGCCYYFMKEYETALKWFEKAESTGKASATTLFNKSRCIEALGRWDEAEKEYRKVLVTTPWYFDCHIRISYHYWDLGRYDLASHELVEAIKSYPKCEDAKVLLGVMKTEKWKLEEAMKLFESVIQENRSNLYAFLGMANVYYKFGKNNENAKKRAVELYMKILKHDVTNIQALNGLAMCLVDIKVDNYVPPIDLICKILAKTNEEQPNKKVAFSLGTLQFYLGNYPTAEATFTYICKTYGDDPTVLNSIAECQFVSGKFEQALKSLERAHEVSDTADIAYNYAYVAWVYFDRIINTSALGKKESETIFEKSLKYLEGKSDLVDFTTKFEEKWKANIEKAVREEKEKVDKRKELEEKRRLERMEEEKKRMDEKEKEEEKKKNDKIALLNKTQKEQEEIRKRLEENQARMESEGEKKKKESKRDKGDRLRKTVDSEEFQEDNGTERRQLRSKRRKVENFIDDEQGDEQNEEGGSVKNEKEHKSGIEEKEPKAEEKDVVPKPEVIKMEEEPNTEKSNNLVEDNKSKDGKEIKTEVKIEKAEEKPAEKRVRKLLKKKDVKKMEEEKVKKDEDDVVKI